MPKTYLTWNYYYHHLQIYNICLMKTFKFFVFFLFNNWTLGSNFSNTGFNLTKTTRDIHSFKINHYFQTCYKVQTVVE